MEYIIRFNEQQKIKTLKINDIEAYNYIIEQLDKDQKEYIVIKINNILSHNSLLIKALLDYEVK